MTVEEAVIRAKNKLNRSEVIDAMDIENLVNSVARHYMQVGRDSAFAEAEDFCRKAQS